jgi:RNA polymerase sigma factor (sigma-70 family)
MKTRESRWANQWLVLTDKGLGASQEEERIRSCLPMVISVCTRFHRRTEDDLQVGLMGLIRAARTWIPERASFPTHAYNCIRNEINHLVDRETTKKRSGGPHGSGVEVVVSREQNPADTAQVMLDSRELMGCFSAPQMELVGEWMGGKSLADMGRERGVTRARMCHRWKECLDKGREFFGL